MTLDGKRPEAEAIRTVFEFWRKEHGHEKAMLDKKRSAKIRARLREGFTVHDLCSAIRGAKKDPFLMGQNDTGTRYDELISLLKDAPKVEKLMGLMGKKRADFGTAEPVDPEEVERRKARLAAAAERDEKQRAKEKAQHEKIYGAAQ